MADPSQFANTPPNAPLAYHPASQVSDDPAYHALYDAHIAAQKAARTLAARPKPLDMFTNDGS
jgi:hypothetical protein